MCSLCLDFSFMHSKERGGVLSLPWLYSPVRVMRCALPATAFNGNENETLDFSFMHTKKREGVLCLPQVLAFHIVMFRARSSKNWTKQSSATYCLETIHLFGESGSGLICRVVIHCIDVELTRSKKVHSRFLLR